MSASESEELSLSDDLKLTASLWEEVSSSDTVKTITDTLSVYIFGSHLRFQSWSILKRVENICHPVSSFIKSDYPQRLSWELNTTLGKWTKYRNVAGPTVLLL